MEHINNIIKIDSGKNEFLFYVIDYPFKAPILYVNDVLIMGQTNNKYSHYYAKPSRPKNYELTDEELLINHNDNEKKNILYRIKRTL